MFLSAILKAHSDGLEHADVSSLVDADETAELAGTQARTADAHAEALAARERRLIELPAIHRARWL